MSVLSEPSAFFSGPERAGGSLSCSIRIVLGAAARADGHQQTGVAESRTHAASGTGAS